MDVSFIIPVYKSVATLEPLYKGIEALMQERQQNFEVVFVEDNGSEESWKELLRLKKEFSNTIKLIKLTKNFGQNAATLCGIDEAKGNVLLTLDDDLQIHPAELKKLLQDYDLRQTDVIYGVYKKDAQGKLRTVGSKLIKYIFNKSEGGSNIGSSIRLISGHIAAHLRNHSQDHLFINQVISWYTFDTKFVEVERNPRKEGKSGYGFFKLMGIALRLLVLYTSIPLRLMIIVCVVSSIGSLALAGYYIYQHFVLGQGLGFLILIVIAISLILASISIMGVYLNRIYASRVKRPQYVIKARL
jgi:polyisoprenyl-phosphate glycosyltransferase